MSRAIGNIAEEEAAELLEAAGYIILERNYFARVGEIDIVAKDGNVICFVEVKQRAYDTYGGGMAAIGKSKLEKILKAARKYLHEHRLDDADYRVDAVIMTGSGLPQILKNIYTEGLA